MFITTVFSFTLSSIRVIKVTNLKLDLVNWVVKPTIFSFISITFGKVVYSQLIKYDLNIGAMIAMVIFIILMIYLLLLKIFNCIKLRD